MVVSGSCTLIAKGGCPPATWMKSNRISEFSQFYFIIHRLQFSTEKPKQMKRKTLKITQIVILVSPPNISQTDTKNFGENMENTFWSQTTFAPLTKHLCDGLKIERNFMTWEL